jgi:glycosyltransferase involved in cell wall biosynthesis
LVADGHSGVLFQPDNPKDLEAQIRRLADDPGKLTHMRHAARQEYEDKYTAEANYRLLMDIYKEAEGTKQRQ